MQKLFHILLIFVCFNALHGMNIAQQTTILCLPKEMIIKIARYCKPIQKNILREVCAYFGNHIKPCTITKLDKLRTIFAYTHENNIEMMRFLLENGAVSVESKNILGMTLFHVAS